MKSILTVIGTRPEAIKLYPVLRAVQKSSRLKSKVCVTGQHTDLLHPFLSSYKIAPDFHLESDKDQNLSLKFSNLLSQFAPILSEAKPDVVVVQGDTTSAFAAALSAFYHKIPVAHVEAGLRSGSFFSPWPEEAHRCLIDQIATYFFVPTERARQTLLSEGISNEKISIVGNTSIDAIRLLRQETIRKPTNDVKSIVVTVHRRENHGKPLEEIFEALLIISRQFLNLQIHFFLHPNPAVRIPAINRLSGFSNIHLEEPMDHLSFIQLVDRSHFLITDSGGIQEEAPFMGKPILVVRETTERPEGIEAGTARLVGTKSSEIIGCCRELLENEQIYDSMSRVHHPYGDGYAAERIVNVLEEGLV